MLKTANHPEVRRRNGKRNESAYWDRLLEREDSLRIVQQQLVDTKKINTDLYDKLKLADEKWRKLEKDLSRIRQQYAEESEFLKKTISNLEMSNAVLQENVQKRNENDKSDPQLSLKKKYGSHDRVGLETLPGKAELLLLMVLY
ncbi:hypothetical protein COOONC_13337 [Cooperia oncophora]